jgi:hypothetical protein
VGTGTSLADDDVTVDFSAEATRRPNGIDAGAWIVPCMYVLSLLLSVFTQLWGSGVCYRSIIALRSIIAGNRALNRLVNTDVGMYAWMDARMDVWSDAWMDGYIYGWMDGWMDGYIYIYIYMDGWMHTCMCVC